MLQTNPGQSVIVFCERVRVAGTAACHVIVYASTIYNVVLVPEHTLGHVLYIAT